MSFLTELNALKTAVSSFITKVNSSFSKNVVNEYIDIAANGFLEYDLVTLLGDNYALYDIKLAKVFVRAKDTTIGSPTLNMYIDADSVITTAIGSERYVKIYSHYDQVIKLSICIDVPKV